MDISNMYYEDYADQSEKDFTHIGYAALSGDYVVEELTGNIKKIVSEIQRKNGADTPIRVYRPV